MKLKNIFFLLILAHYYFNLLGGIHGFYINYIIIGIVNFICTFYLLKTNPFKRLGLFFIFFPFTLHASLIIYELLNYGLLNSRIAMETIAIFIMSTIANLFAILISKVNKKIYIVISYFLLYPIMVINYHNIYNFMDAISTNENINIGKLLPEIALSDSNGNDFLLNELYVGKVLVIDLWNIHCGNCILAFPEFEKVKNDFIHDDRVAFFSVNIYNKTSEIEKSEYFLEPYTFTNYHTDKSVFKTLDFEGVPNYLIIGKDRKIKYFGNLNVASYKSFHNIYKLIENEL
jgi:thiol-disulfide isomerase/thioredoxin